MELAPFVVIVRSNEFACPPHKALAGGVFGEFDLNNLPTPNFI